MLRRFRTAIVHGDSDQHVFGIGLGVFDKHIEVAVVVEDARIQQLVLELFPGAARIGLHQIAIREFRLRILVEILHVGMRRRAVEIEVVLLDVLAVIAFAVGQSEQALFQDRVASVPQCEREAQAAACRPTVPARPSSPQRYARERDWSWVK